MTVQWSVIRMRILFYTGFTVVFVFASLDEAGGGIAVVFY